MVCRADVSVRETADRYVVLGAQRDAWGEGYAKATVGTSLLVELAKAFYNMVQKGKEGLEGLHFLYPGLEG